MSEIYKIRFELVFLVQHPRGPKMSIETAAKYLKKSRGWAIKVLDQYKAHHNVDFSEDRLMFGAASQQEGSASWSWSMASWNRSRWSRFTHVDYYPLPKRFSVTEVETGNFSRTETRNTRVTASRTGKRKTGSRSFNGLPTAQT